MKIFINYFIKIFVIIYFFSNQSVSDDHKLSDSDILFKKAYEFSRSIATISLDENYLKKNTVIFFLDHFKIEPKN